MINVVAPSRYKINKKFVKNLINQYMKKISLGEEYGVNIIFVGKKKMKIISQKYKHSDEILPILSFRYDNQKNSEEEFLGEIFICYPLMILLAAERDKKVDNIMIQLIEHGINNLINN